VPLYTTGPPQPPRSANAPIVERSDCGRVGIAVRMVVGVLERKVQRDGVVLIARLADVGRGGEDVGRKAI